MARLQAKNAGGSYHRFSRINRHSLRDGFNAVLRALLGDRAFLPPSLAGSSASLASASGGRDHTTSASAQATFVRRSIRVHRIPVARVVTIARTSLCIATGWGDQIIDF